MLKKAQARIDEFAFVLLAGVILIVILMVAWTTPTSAIPLVEPNSISLTIGLGTTKSAVLNITGMPSTNVTLSAFGNIAKFTRFSKNNFDVFGSELVTVIFSIPPNVATGLYTGKIIVNSSAGSVNIPVEINVVNITAQPLSVKAIPLGDFSIVGPSKTLDYKENLYVERSYFSERISIISGGFLAEEELAALTGATLQLFISETNGLSNLIVEVNGKEVFKAKVDMGLINIPIDPSIIGEKNVIKIRADLPGWLFWTSAYYRIESAKFYVTLKGIFSKEFIFSLSPMEATNFDRLQIQFIVLKYSSPLPELFIEVNNQPIYAQSPPLALFNATFTKDLYGNGLMMLPGNNTLRFFFRRPGIYDVGNALLLFFYRG